MNIILDLVDLNIDVEKEKTEVLVDLIHNDYEVLISSESITMIYHIINKYDDTTILISKLKDILKIFKVVSTNEDIIYKALELVERHGTDFENRVQYLTALHYNCEIFLTNNTNFEKESPFQIIEL